MRISPYFTTSVNVEDVKVLGGLIFAVSKGVLTHLQTPCDKFVGVK
jgi:hypothetical protein